MTSLLYCQVHNMPSSQNSALERRESFSGAACFGNEGLRHEKIQPVQKRKFNITCFAKCQGSDLVLKQLVLLDPGTMNTPVNEEILNFIINPNKQI